MFVVTVEAKRFVIAACLEPPCGLADVQLGAGPYIDGCHEVVRSAQREKECREKDQHEEAAQCDGTGQRRTSIGFADGGEADEHARLTMMAAVMRRMWPHCGDCLL
jgi:hypothetical protein